MSVCHQERRATGSRRVGRRSDTRAGAHQDSRRAADEQEHDRAGEHEEPGEDEKALRKRRKSFVARDEAIAWLQRYLREARPELMGEGSSPLVFVTARKSGMRIIGPNCLGVMVPRLGLNASFATHAPPATL